MNRSSGESSRWLRVAVVAAAIVAGSLLPVPDGPGASMSWVGRVDLFVHAVSYAAFALVVCDALDAGRDRTAGRIAALALVAVVVAGVVVEGAQATLPWRSASAVDAAANALGAGIAALGRWLAERPER